MIWVALGLAIVAINIAVVATRHRIILTQQAEDIHHVN